MVDELQHDLLAEIASLYYEQELSQSEIGDRLGLSRVKVYRLLKKAKLAGVVEITIHWPVEREAALEDHLRRTFSLDRALVLKSGPQEFGGNGQGLGLRRLGQMAAGYLGTALQDGMTLAVCLGRSSYEVINAFRPAARVRVNVAQAMGSIPSLIPDLDSAVLARQLARKLGGQIQLLSSPLIVNSPAAAQLLRSQPVIERTLRAARGAHIALVGIGGISADTTHYLDAELMTSDQLRQLAADGAVGDIGGQFIRETGELAPVCAQRMHDQLDAGRFAQDSQHHCGGRGHSKSESHSGSIALGRIERPVYGPANRRGTGAAGAARSRKRSRFCCIGCWKGKCEHDARRVGNRR